MVFPLWVGGSHMMTMIVLSMFLSILKTKEMLFRAKINVKELFISIVMIMAL